MKLGKMIGAGLVLAGGIGLVMFFTRKRSVQLQLVRDPLYTGVIQPQFDRALSTPAPTLKLVQATATAPAGSPMAARLQKLGV